MQSGFAHWFAQQEGGRRLLIAALLGALGTAAMPPWYILPALLPSMVGLTWMLRGIEAPRQGLFLGWAWGFGHFTAGCYWIVEAYFVPPADFAAFAFPMVLGLALLLGAFVALALYVVGALALRWPERWAGWHIALMVACALSVAEWLRGWVLTGFPWNPLGHVWAFSDPLLQNASLWGVGGLGLLTAIIFALPSALADREQPRTSVIAGAAVPILLVGCLYFIGVLRLPQAAVARTSTFVRLVQPDIAQGEKWRPELQSRHLARLMALSVAPRASPQAKVTHVIWPETAISYLLNESPDTLRLVATLVADGGYLITGAPRSDSDPAARGRDGQRRFWNSLFAIDATGRIRATYDKAHLVPFGEYLPLHDVIPLLADTIGRGSFTAGSGPQTVALPGLPPFAPIICYEAIFTGAVAPRQPRPDWLLNITNDSWFGHSAGPYQHLVSARMRSVEEGLPLVRVANTGISAMTDPYGRIVAEIGLDLPGSIDLALPAPLAPTLYARFGLSGWCLLLAMVVSIVTVGPMIQRPRAGN